MPKAETKAETLRYVKGLSEGTTETMSEYRAKSYTLAKAVEELGNSRQLSLAFMHLESACQLTIKHLCLTDEKAEFAPI